MDDRTSQPPLISVVLSFRNEEAVIPELIRRLQAALRGAGVRYELLFVNDASTDRSLDFLVRHRQDDPCVKVITMSRRFGVGPCVLAGFRHARGDAVVYMDADLQDPPELVPALIERWRQGADVVHTTRTARRGENPFKLWLTMIAYRVVKMLADYPILEDSGDFKLMSRRVVEAVLSLDERDPFIRGLVGWVGFAQAQVFYERDARFAGTTKFSLWRSANPYREFLRGITGFSELPL